MTFHLENVSFRSGLLSVFSLSEASRKCYPLGCLLWAETDRSVGRYPIVTLCYSGRFLSLLRGQRESSVSASLVCNGLLSYSRHLLPYLLTLESIHVANVPCTFHSDGLNIAPSAPGGVWGEVQ